MFVRISLIFVIVAVAAGCRNELPTNDHTALDLPVVSANTTMPSQTAQATPAAESTYKGVTIDQVFPFVERISAIDDGGREEVGFIEASGYLVHIEGYVPRTLKRDGKVTFSFRTRDSDGYWGTAVGTSHLLGAGSTEIYTVTSGPGAVCCTNYSIVDVSSGRPRSIFHSEDFGGFRSPMEIFDVDGDGIFEIVQFDSCFRYFMDDCGSCSPEPRAYFKFNKAKGQYLPATGVIQDFVREGFQNSDQWLAEKSDEAKHSGDISWVDIRRGALAHMVDLLFVGDEKKAWNVFDKYIEDPSGETRREIKKRLADCKFYQALKRR